MPTISIAINVNGTEKASKDLQARKLKVLLADILPEGGTAEEQAAAVLDWIVARAKDALSDENPRIGNRQYDVMLTAVSAADPTWDRDRVMYEGMDALIAAYDLL
jgi:hypothetical protein